MQIVINIPEVQKKMVDAFMELPPQVENDLISAIRHGTSLPKGHGRLIDANKIVYETECKYTSDGGCTTIRVPNIYATQTVIEADTESEG